MVILHLKIKIDIYLLKINYKRKDFMYLKQKDISLFSRAASSSFTSKYLSKFYIKDLKDLNKSKKFFFSKFLKIRILILMLF